MRASWALAIGLILGLGVSIAFGASQGVSTPIPSNGTLNESVGNFDFVDAGFLKIAGTANVGGTITLSGNFDISGSGVSSTFHSSNGASSYPVRIQDDNTGEKTYVTSANDTLKFANNAGTDVLTLTNAGVLTVGPVVMTEGRMTTSQALYFDYPTGNKYIINDGTNSVLGGPWSFAGAVKLGSSVWESPTAVTVTAATGCTSPTVTWSNGSATFQLDVGTSCTGVSTIGVTFPSGATNGWECKCTNTTASATRVIDHAAGTATTLILTNYSRTTGLASDYADGADVRCSCSGG